MYSLEQIKELIVDFKGDIDAVSLEEAKDLSHSEFDYVKEIYAEGYMACQYYFSNYMAWMLEHLEVLLEDGEVKDASLQEG